MSDKGTPGFAAPELFKGVFYSKEVDIWAFGCFAYELATGAAPFMKKIHRDRRGNLVYEHLIEALCSEEVPPITEQQFSPEYHDFVGKCLVKECGDRWSIDQLLKHEFFRGAKASEEGWLKFYHDFKAR